jgi:hypothetical protein
MSDDPTRIHEEVEAELEEWPDDVPEDPDGVLEDGQ